MKRNRRRKKSSVPVRNFEETLNFKFRQCYTCPCPCPCLSPCACAVYFRPMSMAGWECECESSSSSASTEERLLPAKRSDSCCIRSDGKGERERGRGVRRESVYMCV